MAGYIGSKSSVTQVDGYSEAEADAEFVNDPNDVITVSGSNVGIGTSSPDKKFVVSEGGAHGFEISPFDGSQNSTRLLNYNRSTNAYFPLEIEASQIAFETNGSERMRLDSSGNVGIGTSSPSSLATVASDVNTETRTLLVDNAHSGGSMYNAFGVYVGETDRKVTLSADYGDSIMAFKTNGTEAMRIDASGNVGIGTSTPSAEHNLTIADTTNNGGGKLGLNVDTSGISDNLGRLHFGNATDKVLAAIFGIADGSADAGALTFRTEATGAALEEAMRITSSGNVLVGKTTTSNSVEGISTSQAARTNIASAGEPFYFYYFYSGAQVGSITHNASSTSFNTSSDYRLKENVVDLTGASARVNQLNPSRFNFIADETNTLVDGFLAHEVATVVPEAITGTKDAMMDEEYEVTPAVEATYDEDGNELTAAVEAVMGTRSVPDYQGIDQSKLVPLLTAALQEALTEIASLKTRVEALEA